VEFSTSVASGPIRGDVEVTSYALSTVEFSAQQGIQGVVGREFEQRLLAQGLKIANAMMKNINGVAYTEVLKSI
jgi:hypothetical protein